MSNQEVDSREALEGQAKVLTARMNAVRYIGEQSMWMHGCAHNILKEYEHATNYDEVYAAQCQEIKASAWTKAKACEKLAASLQEKLKYLTDKLAGD